MKDLILIIMETFLGLTFFHRSTYHLRSGISFARYGAKGAEIAGGAGHVSLTGGEVLRQTTVAVRVHHCNLLLKSCNMLVRTET